MQYIERNLHGTEKTRSCSMFRRMNTSLYFRNETEDNVEMPTQT